MIIKTPNCSENLYEICSWTWKTFPVCLGFFFSEISHILRKNCFTFIALICFAKKCENFVKKQIQNILVGKKCENFTKKIRIISCGIYNTCRNVYFGRGCFADVKYFLQKQFQGRNSCVEGFDWLPQERERESNLNTCQ